MLTLILHAQDRTVFDGLVNPQKITMYPWTGVEKALRTINPGSELIARPYPNVIRLLDGQGLNTSKEYYSPVFANRIARGMLDGYLNGRSGEDEAELPVMYTENHGYLRAKGPLAIRVAGHDR